jgi:antitoxin MazE
MRVSKWGNSLAVRLPAAVVKALKLKEGDHIEIRVAGKRKFEVARDPIREWALKEMERLSVPFPSDFKFNREEIHERRQDRL